MSSLFCLVPQPPEWHLDWEALRQEYPWLRPLVGCPQDPYYHGEGDAWVHTRLVCECLVASAGWRDSVDEARQVLFAAALLHDVAKPDCTRFEPSGRVSARGHARRGAIMARRILWRLGTPSRLREQVAALVRFHQTPFHFVEQPDPRRVAIAVSQIARCDHLAILAEADGRGRVCLDQQQALDGVALFAGYCRELGCLEAPYPFPSDHSRFLYFQREGRDPDYLAYDDGRLEVVLVSGLPGAGKDHWIRTHLAGWPVVSLDALRGELAVRATDPQGSVVSRARAQAREHLRQGQPFVWNATNLSRQVRSQCIRLLAAYGARVRIVYVEVPEARLYQQNRSRPHPVPEAVIERLLERWEVPDPTEAHQVDWVATP